MTAKELYHAGQLDQAIQTLSAELRDNPTDNRRRTFLFELLCFAGEWDRAEKHLNLLADQSKEAQMGAVLYLSAVHAERVRHETFAKRDYPSVAADATPRGGALNGKRFESFEDADPRIGPRMEVFAAGAYLWIPLAHVESIETQEPTKLRDLLWTPAIVKTGPAFQGMELGQVLIPVISPFSYKQSDGNVRLGRATEWGQDETGQDVPFGQKVFLVDDEEIPILEIRKVEFDAAAASDDSAEGAAAS